MSRSKELLAGMPATCWKRSNHRRFGTVPEIHEDLVVLFATHGQMNYLIDGQVVQMRPGVLLFAHAGQAHVLLSETRDFDMWVFLVSAQALPAAQRGKSLPPLSASEAGQPTGPRTLKSRARQELADLAETIVAERDAVVRLHGITWWLGRAWHHWLATGASDAQRLNPALDRAVLNMKRDPTLGLDALAHDAGISPARLSHLFRTEMGEGIVTFRNRARLSRLDAILDASPETGLLGAALEAGFGSYPQFYRVFRRIRGTSPGAWYRGRRSG